MQKNVSFRLYIKKNSQFVMEHFKHLKMRKSSRGLIGEGYKNKDNPSSLENIQNDLLLKYGKTIRMNYKKIIVTFN